MAFREAIRIALQSLWANKLRSILTLIGMVIGVASVIMVMTLVAGVNKFVATKIYGYGADVFTASKQPAVVFSDAEYMKYQKRKDLKYDAYEAIAERCTACASTGAMADATGSGLPGEMPGHFRQCASGFGSGFSERRARATEGFERAVTGAACFTARRSRQSSAWRRDRTGLLALDWFADLQGFRLS